MSKSKNRAKFRFLDETERKQDESRQKINHRRAAAGREQANRDNSAARRSDVYMRIYS